MRSKKIKRETFSSFYFNIKWIPWIKINYENNLFVMYLPRKIITRLKINIIFQCPPSNKLMVKQKCREAILKYWNMCSLAICICIYRSLLYNITIILGQEKFTFYFPIAIRIPCGFSQIFHLHCMRYCSFHYAWTEHSAISLVVVHEIPSRTDKKHVSFLNEYFSYVL